MYFHGSITFTKFLVPGSKLVAINGNYRETERRKVERT